MTSSSRTRTGRSTATTPRPNGTRDSSASGSASTTNPTRERPARRFLKYSREWSIVRSVPTTSELERLLRGASLRVTRPRLAVLTAVHAHPHADTDSLIRAVRGELPAVSHQAVYDVLRALATAGLVRRIQPA